MLDGALNGNDVSVRTSFINGTAQTEGNQGTTKISTSHAFSPQTVVLPNGVFTLYAALADRLSRVTAGAELRVHPAARRDRRARRQRSAGAHSGSAHRS